jgi:protein-disulfide isomerase
MTVSTLAIAIAVVQRGFFKPATAAGLTRKPEAVANWRELLVAGRTVGNPSAPVKVIEFGDLQCPYCKDFNALLQTEMNKLPGQVSLVFVHFPIRGHRLAEPAARAAECANAQGRFGQMIDTLYADQASFGQRSWLAFASAAGVKDTVEFSKCLSDSSATSFVSVGREAGRKFRVLLTPTVFVNDWRFGSPPDQAELHQAIQRALARATR